MERPVKLQDKFGSFDSWMYKFWQYLEARINPTLSQNQLVGRYSTGSGPAQAITIGTGLTLSTTGTLVASGGTASLPDQYSIRWDWGTDTTTRTVSDGYQMLFAEQVDMGSGSLDLSSTGELHVL